MTPIDQHSDLPPVELITAENDYAAQNIVIANVGDYALIARDTDDDRLLALWLAQHPNGHTQRQYQRQAQSFCAWLTATGLAHHASHQPRDSSSPLGEVRRGSRGLQSVTFTDLSAWATQLTGSENTRKLRINTLKSLFSFAHRVGYLRVNPAIMLKPPRTADRRHAKVLKEGEIHALIAHAKRPRTKALIRTLYSAGLRIAELCALTWADVIPTKDGKANLIIWGKGAKQREVGISADTYAALLAIRHDGDKRSDDSTTLFRSRSGKPMDRTVIMRMLRDLAKRAGIDRPISPHWFRHSHATHALDRGANPGDVQAQLGHASLTTTSGYIHSSKSSADYLSV